MMIQGEPGMTDRGTRIEVERLDPSGRPGHVT
jgi:hypothetical protein